MATEPEAEETNHRTIQGRGTIEAFINKLGLIALKQDNGHHEEDSVVMMTPGDVPQVIQWLQELAAEAKDMEEEAARERARTLA